MPARTCSERKEWQRQKEAAKEADAAAEADALQGLPERLAAVRGAKAKPSSIPLKPQAAAERLYSAGTDMQARLAAGVQANLAATRRDVNRKGVRGMAESDPRLYREI